MILMINSIYIVYGLFQTPMVIECIFLKYNFFTAYGIPLQQLE